MESRARSTTPQPIRAPPASPIMAPVFDGGEFPRVEELHRAGKGTGERHPSPLKGRRKTPARSIDDLLKNVKITDHVEDDASTAKALGVLNYATELIDSKAKVDSEFEKQVSTLPLLSPGDVLKKDDVGWGFRVHDGNTVLISTLGDVKIESGKNDSDKIKAVVMKYPKGVSWGYWSYETLGPNKMTLSECLTKFGTGVMEPSEGVKVKVIFLTEELSTKPGNFFIVFVLNGEEQVNVKGQEASNSVFRVFRSCVPHDIRNSIEAHHLINIRNENANPIFWEM